MASSKLPYWLVNVPEKQWPSSCPDFLAKVSATDKDILSTLDDDYHRLTWPEVQEVIKTNRIDMFQRVPSDLRRYLSYNAKMKEKYGSVMNFLVKERLSWFDLRPISADPFSDPDDIKILYNDWPYGIDKKIIHLVVWTKFDIEEDPAIGDLTPKARKEINDYVNMIFCKRVPPDRVIWFKNWRSLKSIHSVEHFHVMLYDPDEEFVKEVTAGDIPLSEKVK